MAKFRVIKFGDQRGIGAVIEKRSLFNVTTWTLCPDRNGKGDVEEECGLDKWTCRETGDWHYRGMWAGCRFYEAQFLTQENKAA